MPNLSDLFNTLLEKFSDIRELDPKGPFALAQTRVTQTPHIIAEGGVNPMYDGVFYKGNPNRFVKSRRVDLGQEAYPGKNEFIITPSFKDNPKLGRETIKHEQTHAMLNEMGLGSPLFPNNEIADSIIPNMDPNITSILKKDAPFGFVPKYNLAQEGLAYSVQDPRKDSNYPTLKSFSDYLYKKGDRKNLERLEKLLYK